MGSSSYFGLKPQHAQMNIGIATSGLWKLRKAVELLVQAKPRKTLSALRVDAIAGWGHKPTSDRARKRARSAGLPYIAFEDGFLRSLSPGNEELPLSMVVDRTGIYYDSRQPSDLEPFVRKRAQSNREGNRARNLIDLLRDKRLSKYNNATIHDLSRLNLSSNHARDRVLVIDQTAGDASIPGARATASTFGDMLLCAVEENPGCEVIVKTHPEAANGRKKGYLTKGTVSQNTRLEKPLADNRIRFVSEPINCWSLLEACSRIYCVSSQLGFEGLMAGCEVHTFGCAFYSGWGLTQDRLAVSRGSASLEAFVSALYFDYSKFIDHENNSLMSVEEGVEMLISKRALHSGLNHEK